MEPPAEALNGEVLPAERSTQPLEAYLSGSGHLRPTVHLAKVGQKVRFRQGKRPDQGLQLRARSDLGSTGKCPALTFSSKKVKLGVPVSSGGENKLSAGNMAPQLESGARTYQKRRHEPPSRPNKAPTWHFSDTLETHDSRGAHELGCEEEGGRGQRRKAHLKTPWLLAPANSRVITSPEFRKVSNPKSRAAGADTQPAEARAQSSPWTRN